MEREDVDRAMGAGGRGLSKSRVLSVLLLVLVQSCGTGDDDHGLVLDDEAWTIRQSACLGQALARRPAWMLPIMLSMSGLADQGDAAEVTACATAAADCAAVLACFGVDAAAPCDDRNAAPACTDDHTARYCDTIEARNHWVSFERTYDCDHSGSLRPLCMAGLWGGDEPPCYTETCTDFGERCDGDVSDTCIDLDLGGPGIRARQDCGWMGLRCTESKEAGMTSASCWSLESSGSACMDDYRVGDGTQSFDCRDYDPSFRCIPELLPMHCGLPEDQRACSPDDVRCEGTTGEVCVGGKWFSYDCERFDDAVCQVVPDEFGVGTQRVVCVSAKWEGLLDSIDATAPWR